MHRALSSPRLQGLWVAIAVPLAFFVAAELLMQLIAVTQNGRGLQASTWAKWDSKYYLQIATRGYYLAPCDGSEGPIGATCGNAAWFPAIGWLTGLVTLVGPSASVAMLLLVRLFAFGTLILAWNGLLDRRRDVQGMCAMAFVAFAPGSVYFHALFPISLATFLMVATFVLLRRERWLEAAVCVGLAATTYTTVALMAPMVAIWFLQQPATPLRARLARAAAVLGTTFVGGAAVVATMWAQTGQLDAFSQVQAKYAYDKGFPTRMLFDRIHSISEGTGIGPVLGGQALFVALLMVATVAWWLWRRPRGLELAILLTALMLWLVPLYLGQSSLQRGDALLAPLAFLIARFPRPLAIAAAGGAMLLAGPLAAFYVQGGLI